MMGYYATSYASRNSSKQAQKTPAKPSNPGGTDEKALTVNRYFIKYWDGTEDTFVGNESAAKAHVKKGLDGWMETGDFMSWKEAEVSTPAEAFVDARVYDSCHEMTDACAIIRSEPVEIEPQSSTLANFTSTTRISEICGEDPHRQWMDDVQAREVEDDKVLLMATDARGIAFVTEEKSCLNGPVLIPGEAFSKRNRPETIYHTSEGGWENTKTKKRTADVPDWHNFPDLKHVAERVLPTEGWAHEVTLDAGILYRLARALHKRSEENLRVVLLIPKRGDTQTLRGGIGILPATTDFDSPEAIGILSPVRDEPGNAEEFGRRLETVIQTLTDED